VPTSGSPGSPVGGAVHRSVTAAGRKQNRGQHRARSWPTSPPSRPHRPGPAVVQPTGQKTGAGKNRRRLTGALAGLRRWLGPLTALHDGNDLGGRHVPQVPVGDREGAVADLDAVAVLGDRRAGRRRRAAGSAWTSGSSAAAASCPSLSAPGTCSPLDATSAAKPASPPTRGTTRSVTASRARTHSTLPGGRVQQTGRFDAVPDTILTGTRTRGSASHEVKR
jgi:hypothetical protein